MGCMALTHVVRLTQKDKYIWFEDQLKKIGINPALFQHRLKKNNSKLINVCN